MKRFLILLLFVGRLAAQSVGLPNNSPQLPSNLYTTNPAGTGGITSVAALPATCTPGVTPPVQLNVSPYGIYNCTATNVWTAAGSTAGNTFGGSPSSGYTFTSTPITASPFSGNLLVGTMIKTTDAGTLTAGTGWTIAIGTGTTLGIEYQTGAAASSYSSAFTNSNSQVWGATVSAFTATNPALVQAKTAATTTLAYNTNNAAGNLLFAAIRYTTATGPITGVTCNGNTWKLAGLRGIEAGIKGVGDTAVEEIWYAPNSVSGACTITPAGVSGVSVEIAAAEFSGVATSSPLVDYNYNADGTGNTATTTPAGATTNNQYLYQAINNTTGNVDFSGRDHAVIFRNAANNLASTCGQLFHKRGIYNGQSSIQEVNNSQTNWYVFSLPPNGGSNCYWDLVGEIGTQASGNNQQGTIFQALPSAYAGPAPSGGTLSVLWQRPASSAVQNSVIFRNMACRIPDNQRSPTICYDSFETTYSSHINTLADTAIPYTDQLCSGITPAVSNMTGFRTNQATTNESYFENTWSIGWNTPYNILSNHTVGINMHSLCNQNAGVLSVASSLYGDQLIHFQDIHNIIGLQLTCAAAGTRFDIQNMIREIAVSGSFAISSNATETNPGNCVGKIDVTTAIANGTGTAIPAFFSSGGANLKVNESTRTLQPGLITSSSTSAATTGTTKQTLATYTIPFISNSSGNGGSQAGIFASNAGAVLRVTAWGITATNGNTKTVEIDLGGTAISLINSVASNGVVKVSADIVIGATSVQECIGYTDDGTLHSISRTSPGITGTANVVVNLAATTPTASGDFTFKGWTIEYLGGN